MGSNGTTEIDRALALWERFDEDTRGRKGRQSTARTAGGGRRGADSGAPLGSAPGDTAALRASLARTVARTPEVIVRVTGHARDMASIRRAVAYQTQAKGRDAVAEDERGVLYQGPGSERDAVETWQRGVLGPPIPAESSPLAPRGGQHAMNLVLSMPAGTPIDDVLDAARAFGRQEFGGRHAYVFTAHDDTDHAHVHMTVRMTGHDGRRLRTWKDDLSRYRATFARELRARGIAANATTKYARRAAARSVSQPVYHARIRRGQQPRPAPSPRRTIAPGTIGHAAQEAYRAAEQAFGRSPDPSDRALATAIRDYVEDGAARMPRVRTRSALDAGIDATP